MLFRSHRRPRHPLLLRLLCATTCDGVGGGGFERLHHRAHQKISRQWRVEERASVFLHGLVFPLSLFSLLSGCESSWMCGSRVELGDEVGGCRTTGARCAREEMGRQALALSARSLEKDRKTSLFDGLSLKMSAAFSIFFIGISLSPSRTVMHFLIRK